MCENRKRIVFKILEHLPYTLLTPLQFSFSVRADLSEFSLLLVGNSYPLPISSSLTHISSEELCIHSAGPAISNTKMF